MRSNLTSDVLEVSLRGIGKRMEMTGINIANMNTPQYARHEISFESQLHDVVMGPGKLPMTTVDPMHISNVTRAISEIKLINRPVGYELYRGDSNTVEPETETARLTESRMMYQALAARLAGKFRDLKRVMTASSSNA